MTGVQTCALPIFDINHFTALLKEFDVLNKEFDYNKGFKISSETYLVISKDRQDTYDSYTFDFRNLEFYNILDLKKSN